MRLDRHATSIGLTKRQLYFAGCWLNLVHQHSLDSYRAPAMNPLNVLPELLRIYELGKVDERKAVRSEAYRILSNDAVLRLPSFIEATERILQLLDDRGLLAIGKEEGKGVALLGYFVAELQALLTDGYIKASLDHLSARLEAPDPTDSTGLEVEFEELQKICRNLVRSLIFKRVSLESLYSLYSEVLIPRSPKPSYQFNKRYRLLTTLLTQQAVQHHIVLVLDNVTQPEAFPTSIGGFEFGISPPYTVDAYKSRHLVQRTSRYLSVAKRRLFASTHVLAQDPRSAGADAAERLNDILNLVRFEYERERVSMPEAFAYKVATKPENNPRIFPLPAVVPNPNTPMDVDGLAAFVKSVDELVRQGKSFSAEGRDRVTSAFRLYRIGLDSTALENKLVNWWTALEFLVRGNTTQSGGIGKSVEDQIAPVLCRSYIAKHLLAFRIALLEAGAKPTELDGTLIELKTLSLDKLLEVFKREDIQRQLHTSVAGHEFFSSQLNNFFNAIADPRKLSERNAAHEQRLRWQLQRLWRARCDVVHSAERSASATLLCANLEYYLKSTLMALLRTLRDVPTLSGPKEFFDRQTIAYESMQKDLAAGSYIELTKSLSA